MFKDLTDNDIEEVEIFVRQRLLPYLISKKYTDLNEDSMIKYFGETYAHDTHQFKIRIGDKKIIRIIIAHVKQMVDDDKIAHMKLFKTTLPIVDRYIQTLICKIFIGTLRSEELLLRTILLIQRLPISFIHGLEGKKIQSKYIKYHPKSKFVTEFQIVEVIL